MSSLPARMKKIKLKMKVLDCPQDYSKYKSMGIFPDAQGQLTLQCSRAANSAVHGPIWSNFELVQDFMVVLLTCKNEEDPIKNRGARVFTTLLHRNIHLTLTLKSLCMIRLKGDDEVLINNRHRTVQATYGSIAIIDLFFVISF